MAGPGRSCELSLRGMARHPRRRRGPAEASVTEHLSSTGWGAVGSAPTGDDGLERLLRRGRGVAHDLNKC